MSCFAYTRWRHNRLFLHPRTGRCHPVEHLKMRLVAKIIPFRVCRLSLTTPTDIRHVPLVGGGPWGREVVNLKA
jgi:hypothetical protein